MASLLLRQRTPKAAAGAGEFDDLEVIAHGEGRACFCFAPTLLIRPSDRATGAAFPDGP